MKLWGYYAWHSFKNTIKKLFRCTFVIVVFAIIGIGVIFGTAGGIIGLVAERQSAEEAADETYKVEDEEEDEDKDVGIDADAVKTCAESAVAVIFILCLLFGLYAGSKKGTDIFLMADVNFLFTAPMKPQSVLMFRLTFQMAAALLASVYLLAQIPNLVNIGLGASAIAGVFVGWVLLLVFQRLMVVLSYTLCATHERLKKYLLPFIACVVLFLLAVTAAVYARAGRDPIAMLDALYASGWSRWIPVVGWYKGMIRSAVDQDLLHFLIFLLLLFIGIVFFVWLIWRLKADFYEDALTQASKREETLAAAKEGRAARVKERSKRISRTGSFGGSGGSVFFTKTMYDRKRMARFGIVTNTMLLNLAVGVLVTLFMQRVADNDTFLVTGIVLMAVLFFRNFGNPIAQEASMNWLFLVPDSPYRKVFYTILAGSVCCALDLLPALAAGFALTREALPVMLLWLVVFLVMDFMLSAVGAFLEAVFPASAMDMVKSMLRMMLHFFMILVVTVLMAVGFLLGGTLLALALTAAGCAVVGGLFFLIYPSMLHGGTA